ncbi:MAG: 1-acyl-sn-glycerol-3-phosphate acyltransferase [Alphaproteobacteria bacterium]|nr:1-acyl-sn-glycerol-3-phosphate acyltransferase [Alphaproteobacteria bacterium]MDE1968114.1 1-acyl-sn-glycerol-3-phosphate acyltransferase [Alphaproteobacteria bacterium]MDE2514243.1 1-acyl-sn-glycerol-3-phosphate acyltransferase [Alphaproteobacteria bacterium]
MILLRSLIFQLAFWSWTALMAFAGLPFLLGTRRGMLAFGTFWARGVFALLRGIVGLDYEMRGRRHLPVGPCIVAMKHQSAWDTLAATILFPDCAVVIKRELGWLPFYGWYVVKAGSITVDRGAASRALRRMVKRAERVVAERRTILIFPQGTRTAVGARKPYLPGIAALYQQLELPVVPVAVNSGLFWGRRQFMRRPGTVLVEILPPIVPGKPRPAFMAELERRIETATDGLVAEGRARGHGPWNAWG